jgi:phosphate transport system substrate-binding protein
MDADRIARFGRVGLTAVALAGVAGTLAACGGGDSSSSSSSTTASAASGGDGSRVTAAGSTFAAPAYQKWGQDTGLVSYTGTGSGAGIQALIAGTVGFAGSDAPLSPDERSQLSSQRGGVTPVYFPTLLGAVTVPVNLPDLGGRLRLDGNTLGQIYAGTITNWNDPAIAKTNPSATLPDAPIIVCARSESSGTSFNFSTYLAKVSPSFKAKVQPDKTPAWGAPNIQKAQGNPGVANCVTSNDDSIGYVDLGDAQRAGLQSRLAAIQAKDGAFVVPSTASVSAAGNITPSQVPSDLVVDLTNSPAKGAYPITITTWIVTPSDYTKSGRPKDLAPVQKFLRYAYGTKAQGELAGLGYAPLSSALKTPAVAQIDTLK